MHDKMAISAYNLKIAKKNPFLRPQLRVKEDFNGHQCFLHNKRYVKIKLMQTETNRWSIFFVKTKYCSIFDFNV